MKINFDVNVTNGLKIPKDFFPYLFEGFIFCAERESNNVSCYKLSLYIVWHYWQEASTHWSSYPSCFPSPSPHQCHVFWILFKKTFLKCSCLFSDVAFHREPLSLIISHPQIAYHPTISERGRNMMQIKRVNGWMNPMKQNRQDCRRINSKRLGHRLLKKSWKQKVC